ARILHVADRWDVTIGARGRRLRDLFYMWLPLDVAVVSHLWQTRVRLLLDAAATYA
ncbi:hypothetical protein GW17_00056164, partial [Ensete ventricosum]